MRCPWAIRFGVTLNTRCDKGAPHLNESHESPGLAEFPHQRIEWFGGDRRSYETTRLDVSAWEQDPCPVRSSVTGNECLLPAGHPQDSPWRFHRYARAGGGLEQEGS